MDIGADSRRAVRPADGLLLRTGGRGRESDIAKALREATPLEPADMGRFLDIDLALVDPAERRIGLLAASAARPDHWFAL